MQDGPISYQQVRFVMEQVACCRLCGRLGRQGYATLALLLEMQCANAKGMHIFRPGSCCMTTSDAHARSMVVLMTKVW